MDYTKIGLFNALKQKLRYDSERQTVLAKNIASANIPEAKAKDLKPVSFDELVAGSSNKLHMSVTDARHIIPARNSGTFKVQNDGTAFETTPVGNNIVLEEQALKMADNNTDYQKTTGMYSKFLELLRMASGGNR